MKKLRIGIAGLGRFGRLHGFNIAFKIPNAVLTAVCATSDATLTYAKNELQVQNLYKDFDEFLKCDEMDAVVICTPSQFHVDEIIKSLEAGYHVFTEKPLGINVSECKRCEQIVEKHKDKKFMVGFMRRFDKSYAYAKEKIDKGLIGTPYLIKSTSLDSEATINDTIKYSKHSAGIFLDLGIHDMDLMHYFLGSDAIEVIANGATFKYKELMENGDTEAAVAMYKFENGAMGLLHVGRAGAHGNHVETEIVGTDGSIRISAIPCKNLAQIYKTGGVLTECIEEFTERWVDAYLKEIEVFADCILNDKPCPITVYDGSYAVNVGIATMESLKTGSLVKI